MSPQLKQEVVEDMAEAVVDMALALMHEGEVPDDMGCGNLLLDVAQVIVTVAAQFLEELEVVR